eukprot:g5777.t1
MIVEFCVGKWRKRKSYRLNDTIMSVNLGLFQQLGKIWWGGVGITCYCHIYKNFAWYRIPHDSALCWVGLLVGCDFGYYWFHRFAHEYHFLWAAHSVHHSGEDYNLATALRQGLLQPAVGWIFYQPLALFFHPAMYVVHQSLNTLYQFWIHTELVGSIGPLEYILNTASHHRMHHRPPGNCNYGGVFIIWDRMFGTFTPEDKQRSYYGLARQYETFDPIHANIEHPRRMAKNIRVSSKQKTGFCSRISAFFKKCLKKRVKHKQAKFDATAVLRPLGAGEMKTLWTLPNGAPERKKLQGDIDQYPLSVRFAMKGYIFFNFLVLLVASYILLLTHEKIDVITKGTWTVWICLSLSSIGRLCDGKNGTWRETVRLCLLVLFGYFEFITLPSSIQVYISEKQLMGILVAKLNIWCGLWLWWSSTSWGKKD